MGQPKGKAKVKAAAKQKAKASALLARRLSPQGPNNPNAPRQASPGLEPQRQAGRAQSVGSHAAPPWRLPGGYGGASGDLLASRPREEGAESWLEPVNPAVPINNDRPAIMDSSEPLAPIVLGGNFFPNA